MCENNICPQCNSDGITSCTADTCTCKLGFYGVNCESGKNTYLSSKLKFIMIDIYVIKRFNSFYFILECENCNANGIEDASSCENSCTCKSGYADAGGIGCSVCASGYFGCASPSASLCDESTDCTRKGFHTFMKC